MTYNAELGFNVLPESLGALKRISNSGEVEDLGNVWYSEQPYNVCKRLSSNTEPDLQSLSPFLFLGLGLGLRLTFYST